MALLRIILLFIINSVCYSLDGWIITGSITTSTPPCEELCVGILGDTSNPGDLLGLYGCVDIRESTANQRWRYENFTLSVPSRTSQYARLCMSASLQNNSVFLEVCQSGKSSQYWVVDDINKSISNRDQLYLKPLLDTNRRYLSPLEVSKVHEANFTFLEYEGNSSSVAVSTGLKNGDFSQLSPWSYQFLPVVRGEFPYSVCNWVVGNDLRDMEITSLRGNGCPSSGLNLNGSNSISQRVLLDKAEQYILSFQHSKGSCNGTGNVEISKQVTYFMSLDNGTCKVETVQFNSSRTGEVDITFRGTSGDQACGPMIAKVGVNKRSSIAINPSGDKSSCSASKVWLISGVTVGSMVAVELVVWLLYYKVWKRFILRKASEDISLPWLRRYMFREIKFMTNNFNHCIGKGGFGSVFLATASSGSRYAVKVFEKEGTDFQIELDALGRVHHRCIVECHGYCLDGGKLYLILEYMSQGSLFDHLHRPNQHTPLSWKDRVRIAKDVAHGLAYLHHGANPPIIHRDVKPANILLDEDFSAKLADFGVSRVGRLAADGTKLETTRTHDMRGTFAYLDLEAFQTTGAFVSGKTDVYSFGITLLEMISGKRPGLDEIDIVGWAKSIESLADIVDPAMEGTYDVHQLDVLYGIAMLCVGDYATRPLMSKVCDLIKDLGTEEIIYHGTSSSAGNGTNEGGKNVYTSHL